MSGWDAYVRPEVDEDDVRAELGCPAAADGLALTAVRLLGAGLVLEYRLEVPADALDPADGEEALLASRRRPLERWHGGEGPLRLAVRDDVGTAYHGHGGTASRTGTGSQATETGRQVLVPAVPQGARELRVTAGPAAFVLPLPG